MNTNDLNADALTCLAQGPFSVTHKKNLKFTTNPHDYVSGRLYWWREGDEYVRRDGQINPETRGPDYDRQRLDDFIHAVVTLTRAYQQYGEKKFGARAAEYVSAWFLDPNLRMNPHLEYAQIDPGSKKVRGFGIIDTYDFLFLLDSIDALVAAGFTNAQNRRRLKQWFDQFTKWLLTNSQGKKEGKRVNNHGTSYDVQVIRYLLFCGKTFRARWRIKRCVKLRLGKQIDDMGRQPEEADRTKSLFYHWYNLSKLIHLCEMGARLGQDLIHHEGKIRTAIEYLVPYVQHPERWPLEQVAPVDLVEMSHPIQLGASVFDLVPCREIIRLHPETFEAPYYLARLESLGTLLGNGTSASK